MKEELIELRDVTSAYSIAKKKFEERKRTFNEDTKETMVILKSTVVAADYDTACEFYDEYTVLREFAEKLKQEHPRYGEKRVRETLLELVRTAECYQDRTLCAEQIVGAYLTFEKCGFNEVKELETEANKLGIKLANSVDTVKTGTIDNTVETVNRTIETVKPYAEQAKKHLNVLGGMVRSAASEGAKRLIKILDESNDKKDE